MKHDPFKFWTDPVVYFLVVLLTLVGVVVFIDRAHAYDIGVYTGPSPGWQANQFSFTVDTSSSMGTLPITFTIPDVYSTSSAKWWTILVSPNQLGQTLTVLGNYSDFWLPGVHTSTITLSSPYSKLYVYFSANSYSPESVDQHPNCDYYCARNLPPNRQPVDTNWTSDMWTYKELVLSGSGFSNQQGGDFSFDIPESNVCYQSIKNWVYSVDNVNPGETYYIHTTWTAEDTYGNLQSSFESSALIPEDTSEDLNQIPISKKLDFALDTTYPTTTVVVSGFLTNSPDRNSGTVYDSSTVTFFVNVGNCTNPNTEAGDRAQYWIDTVAQVSSTYSYETCPSPEDWTDIGGGVYWAFCEAGYKLIIPSTSSVAFFTNAFSGIQNIYPFKYYFEVSQAAQSQMKSSSSTPTLVLDYSNINPTFSNAPEIVLLSSSTLSNLIGSSSTAQIFQVQKYILWTLVAGFVLTHLLYLLA